MPRAVRVIAPGHRQERPVADTVYLDHEQRRTQKNVVAGVKGTQIEIDLAVPVRLQTDDLLELDDGTLVEVIAAPEPLIEARAKDLPSLARLAWHLGDRHIPVEMLANRVRARRDPAVVALLKRLGAKLVEIEAPFEPEGGAYAGGHSHGHDHDHGHGHAHDHAHGHHHEQE